MARMQVCMPVTTEKTLSPVPFCWVCRHPTYVAYHGHRLIVHLWGNCRYTLVVRRCVNRACIRYHVFIRPEEEGGLALPNGRFGLDVIAMAGQLRFAGQHSLAGIYARLQEHGVGLAPRSVASLVRGYAALVALPTGDAARLAHRLRRQDRVVLAVDAVQPGGAGPVLWVSRDVLSGTVLLAHSLGQAQGKDLVALVGEVSRMVPVPIAAVLCTGLEANGAGPG